MGRRAVDEDDVLAEAGLAPADVAGSAARVFGAVSGCAVDAECPGWGAVVRAALAMFQGSGDDELSLTARNFATMLRRAYARAGDDAAEPPPFEALPAPVRIAWEAVARHLTNVCNLERGDNVEAHEARIIDFSIARLLRPA